MYGSSVTLGCCVLNHFNSETARCKGLASTESSFRIYSVNTAVLQSSERQLREEDTACIWVPVTAGSWERWNHTLLQSWLPALQGVGKDSSKAESGETAAVRYLYQSPHLDESWVGIFTWVQGEEHGKMIWSQGTVWKCLSLIFLVNISAQRRRRILKLGTFWNRAAYQSWDSNCLGPLGITILGRTTNSGVLWIQKQNNSCCQTSSSHSYFETEVGTLMENILKKNNLCWPGPEKAGGQKRSLLLCSIMISG